MKEVADCSPFGVRKVDHHVEIDENVVNSSLMKGGQRLECRWPHPNVPAQFARAVKLASEFLLVPREPLPYLAGRRV
jgi:hypothetical protein